MEPGLGRKPGVACNKHQGRELKTSTISFQNPILHNTHQKQRRQMKNETRFPCHSERPEMAPVNIRKHDRPHGAKPSLNVSPPFFPLIPKNDRQNTKSGFTTFGLRALGRLTAGIEKSEFSGHQFGVQKPQQKPVPPQRASPACGILADWHVLTSRCLDVW